MSEHVKSNGKSVTIKDEKGKITNNISLQGKSADAIPTPAPARSAKSAQEEPVLTDSDKELRYRLSVASIIGMEPTRGADLRSLVEDDGLPSPDASVQHVEGEMSGVFRRQAAVTQVKRKMIPTVIAHRINAKYPMLPIEDRFGHTVNPMAVKIARRYMSLFGDKL